MLLIVYTQSALSEVDPTEPLGKLQPAYQGMSEAEDLLYQRRTMFSDSPCSGVAALRHARQSSSQR